LESFDRLSVAEQHDAIREILLRCESQPLTDDALTEIANESFLELDRREQKTL
jgi:hypothetical protein